MDPFIATIILALSVIDQFSSEPFGRVDVYSHSLIIA